MPVLTRDAFWRHLSRAFQKSRPAIWRVHRFLRGGVRSEESRSRLRMSLKRSFPGLMVRKFPCDSLRVSEPIPCLIFK